MKSKLMSMVDVDKAKQFLGDVAVLANLPDGALRGLEEVVPKVAETHSDRDTLQLQEQTAQRLALELPKLKSALDASQFFFYRFSTEEEGTEDSVSDIVQDLVELKIVLPNRMDSLTKYLTSLRKYAIDFGRIRVKARSTTIKCLPVLSGIEVAIDYRPVMKHQFQPSDKIDDYEPECLGLVAVPVVKLELKWGQTDNHFMFQTDKATIQTVIDFLKGAQKDMEAAERFLNLDVLG